MNKTEELMALADEYECNYTGTPEGNSHELEAEAREKLRTAIEQALAEAVAAERERCAKVLIELPGTRPITRREAAAAIRKGEVK